MTPQEQAAGGKQQAGSNAYETLALTRDIVGDTGGVYALRVKGDGMIDALIADGDIVILRRVTECENGDMVAVYVKSLQVTTLKRWFADGARVRLQPENAAYPPLVVDRADCEVQGKVIAVIRNNLSAPPAAPAPAPTTHGYQPKDARKISDGETAATGNAAKRVNKKLERFNGALFDL